LKIINMKFFAMLSLAGSAILLSACSSSPSPWTKNASPWDQRRNQQATEAPAADQYKQDLAAVDQGASPADVQLNYETGKVQSDMPVESTETPPAAAETLAVAAPEPETPAVPADVSGADEIRSQPASSYTVQVIAAVDRDRVFKFAEQNQLSVRYIIPTQRDGVTWYVLLLDIYPDYPSAKAAAAEAAATLPTKPWVRKLGSVQKLMN